MGVVPRDSTVKLILKGTGIYNVFDFERGITAQKKGHFQIQDKDLRKTHCMKQYDCHVNTK